jgi:periplasmic divalent cation tolerance protein
MNQIVEVTTTVGSSEAALQLANSIVTSRLAACVQIDGPITSIYRWQGQVCEAQEWRCTMKTLASLTQQLVASIHSLHPYDVPEVLVITVEHCEPAYATWLAEQVSETNDA